MSLPKIDEEVWKSPTWGSRSLQEPVTAKVQEVEVEVDTPMGKRTYTWGKWGREYFDGDYRGQEFGAIGTVERLLKEINHIEEEHQVKVARDKKRKEVAKTPVEAIYARCIGRSGHHWNEAQESARGMAHIRAFEPVLVRGVDLRSGHALVILDDGTKTQVRFEYLVSGDADIADFRALYKQWSRAQADLREFVTYEPDDVLRAHLGQPLELQSTRDVEAEETVIRWAGKDFRGKNNREAIERIKRWLLNDAGFCYEIHSRVKGMDEPYGRVLDGKSWSIGNVVRTKGEAEAYVALEQKSADLMETILKAVADEAFDRSLVEVPEEAEEKTEDAVEVPHIQAPQHEDDF